MKLHAHGFDWPGPTWHGVDASAMLYHGEALETLRTLPDESANCCVTSPPYFWMRDYGTGSWEEGEHGCDHRIPESEHHEMVSGGEASCSHVARFNRRQCYKCGANRVDKQIGLEETPNEYIARLADVFMEVHRVLRKDGTLWVNIADSYVATMKGDGGWNRGSTVGMSAASPKNIEGRSTLPKQGVDFPCLKPKDLVGIPWWLAFTLQAKGWWWRDVIIWHKPNALPEPRRDRCTKAHEYILMFSKSRRYYYDSSRIMEDSLSFNPAAHDPATWTPNIKGNMDENGVSRTTAGLNLKKTHEKRNKRSVWSVNTIAYPEAHFAVYPPDLIRPCVLAGCPEGGIVLDPFAGSGTTGMVAVEHDRNAVLIELGEKHLALIAARAGKAALYKRRGGPLFVPAQ